jgi:hypothetical protein
MANNPTLVQMFGTAATQTATLLTITKADLVNNTAWTFTPSANNTAESLFVALMLKARLGSDQSVDAELTFSDITQSLVTRNNIRVRRYSCTVEWYVTDSLLINVDGI